MTTMTVPETARKISPMQAVANMEQTFAFYQDVLGFTAMMKSSEYSILERDGQTIQFMKAASDEVMTCVRGHTEIYLEVSGIGSLREHVKTFKDRASIRDLFDREYGMTELAAQPATSSLAAARDAT